jgi:hypothetical protein
LKDNELTLRALVTARLSVATTTIESEERRLKLAHEALSLAQAANDESAQAYALAALCDALAGPEHCQVRASYASDIIERARRLRNWPLELLGRRLRFVAVLELGNRAAAEAEITAYRIRSESFSHQLYRWYVPLWRAMWALAEGRFAQCRELNEQAESEGVSAGSHNALLLGITQRWCLLGEQEDRQGLDRLFGAMDLEQVGGSWARVPAALLQAQLGKSDEARQRLDALAGQLPFLPRDSEWLAYMAQIAETIGLIGSHSIASWTYEALLPFGDLFVIEGIGAAIRGPVQRHLGILGAAMGQTELAERHFDAALQAARTLGAPQLAARIERDAKRSQVQHAADNVFRRNGELWTVYFGGLHVQLRDSKGIHDLAVLLTRPGTHIAAVDLAGAVNSGDAGEVLDASARDAYRRRIIELEEDAAEADAAADVARSARIAAERDALLAQLSAAYGLGGRARRSGSAAERARSAVTARLREAIKRIEAVHPQLGRHVLHSVKTGTFCVYEPESPTRWQVHQ